MEASQPLKPDHRAVQQQQCVGSSCCMPWAAAHLFAAAALRRELTGVGEI